MSFESPSVSSRDSAAASVLSSTMPKMNTKYQMLNECNSYSLIVFHGLKIRSGLITDRVSEIGRGDGTDVTPKLNELDI